MDEYLLEIAVREYDRRKNYGRSGIDLSSFMLGWVAYQQWKEEQELQDRDYMEEMDEMEALRRGLG